MCDCHVVVVCFWIPCLKSVKMFTFSEILKENLKAGISGIIAGALGRILRWLSTFPPSGIISLGVWAGPENMMGYYSCDLVTLHGKGNGIISPMITVI